MNAFRSYSREIRKLDRDVVIVFITNMAQYAVQGYEVGAFDFVVKPVSYYDFAMKLGRSIEKIRQADERSLAISLDGGVRKITVSRIRYVEVMKHRLTYHTEDGKVEAGGIALMLAAAYVIPYSSYGFRDICTDPIHQREGK